MNLVGDYFEKEEVKPTTTAKKLVTSFPGLHNGTIQVIIFRGGGKERREAPTIV